MLAAQPPRRERDRVRGGAVEPLDVVDRNEHRLARGERAQRAENAGANGARLARRGASLGVQERDLERAGLRGGEVGQRLVGYRPEQVGHSDEGKPGLGRVADALQDQLAVCSRDLEQCMPDGGLPDPGRALDDQHTCRAGFQERPPGLELEVPPEKRYAHPRPDATAAF